MVCQCTMGIWRIEHLLGPLLVPHQQHGVSYQISKSWLCALTIWACQCARAENSWFRDYYICMCMFTYCCWHKHHPSNVCHCLKLKNAFVPIVSSWLQELRQAHNISPFITVEEVSAGALFYLIRDISKANVFHLMKYISGKRGLKYSIDHCGYSSEHGCWMHFVFQNHIAHEETVYLMGYIKPSNENICMMINVLGFLVSKFVGCISEHPFPNDLACK